MFVVIRVAQLPYGEHGDGQVEDPALVDGYQEDYRDYYDRDSVSHSDYR